MRPCIISLALVCLAPSGLLTGADPTQTTTPTGITIDYKGPPEGGDFTLMRIIYFEGLMIPRCDVSTRSAFQSRLTSGEKFDLELKGFVVKKAGEGKLEVLGWKKKDGTLLRVRRIEFKSPNLPADMVPHAYDSPPKP